MFGAGNLGLNTILVGVFGTAFFSQEIFSLPPRELEDSLVDIELLSENSSPNVRIRREADSNMPDHLSFKVSTPKGATTLHMRRTRLLPTVTSHSNITKPFLKNAAVYIDIDNAGSMIVRRNGDRDYSLRGSFLHGQVEWHLEPLTRVRRQVGGVKYHRLLPGHPEAEIISYVGDAIVDDEPPVEILSLEERNRYRLLRLSKLRAKENINITQSEVTGHRREMNGTSATATAQHVVEMVFVVDYADYRKWVAYEGAARAISEMTLWYSYIAESVDSRFRTISDSTFQIGTRVTFLKILTRDSDDDFIEDLTSSGSFDGSQGLRAFRTWYQDPRNGIPNADHYMLFTGYVLCLGFDLDQGYIGIAYLDRLCTASGVSITKNRFSGWVGKTAAHEVGHSLSARHDGDVNGCTNTPAYIMSGASSVPVTTANSGNPWQFSSCSVAAFKSYLRTVSCTEPQNTGTTDRLPAPTGDNRAGLTLSTNDQCKLYFQDSTSSYCSGVQSRYGGISGICNGMWCTIPSRPGYCRAMVPLEYTYCGFGKWCRMGLCVNNDRTTTSRPIPAPGPQTIFDCVPYLQRLDLIGLLACFRLWTNSLLSLYVTFRLSTDLLSWALGPC
ncbi:hypothetical protein RRG08_001672 [Elysia crispata]|uniref:Peptidase M12B domain-containing protein n=1 Tax=Elysia crispata TaxID=231223 RepID=A0AAE1AM74_9GAST|nr:hypothetical protein RRG08_001672 [Elysia crispata]